MSILARREDQQQLQWISGSEFSPEEVVRHADYALRESCSEVFGILPQLPTEAVELSGHVVLGLSR